ncbi:MAG: chemotaxis protein CheA [Candidatus Methylomirabilales bacterium]
MGDGLEYLTPEDQELLRSTFFAQSGEILETLHESILALEGGPPSEELLGTIQRALHTLKGDAASFGMSDLSNLAHKLEDLLSPIRDGSLPIDQQTIDLLLEGADLFGHLLQAARTGDPSPPTTALLARLEKHLRQEVEDAPPPGQSITEYQQLQVEWARREGLSLQEITVTFDPDCRLRSAGAHLVAQQIRGLGDLITVNPPLEGNLDVCATITFLVATAKNGDVLEAACRIPGVVAEVTVRGHTPSATQGTRGSAPPPPSSTIRVETQRVDKVMNLVGELTIIRSMFTQSFGDLEGRVGRDDTLLRLVGLNDLVDRTLNDLQKSVMRLRMVPIDLVFRRLPRMIRDLSRELNKEIRLNIEGRSTELDKGLVDRIGEPLLHLIRNAADHGIESPAIRRELRKPEAGSITVTASHEGNQTIIQVEDDGQGIDPQAIRLKAVERGLIDADEAQALSDGEALHLIFLPGFSTVDRVTDLSGRGIGMDAVRATVEELKGTIQIASQPGQGTRITLTLPLTLAIIKAILVKEEDEAFALPLSAIAEITRVVPQEIATIEGREVFRLRQQVLSLLRLRDLLALPTRQEEASHLHVLVLAMGERRIGLAVERLLGEEELVIKILERTWINAEIIAGASLLGDGRVILILHAPALLQLAVDRERRRRGRGAA